MAGTAGYDKAAQYAVTQFRQAGLLPVYRSSDSTLSYYQNVPIHKFNLGPNTWVTITKDQDERTFSIYKNFFISIREPLKGQKYCL